MLFGQAAIVWSLYEGVLRRARAPLIVAIAFFAEWLPWALNPKGLEFYYYFYPSIVCLGPALALFALALKPPWRDAFVWATLGGGACDVRVFPALHGCGHRRRAHRIHRASVVAELAMTGR